MQKWTITLGGTAQSVLRFAGVMALFTLLTGLIFWPWMAHLSAALIGPPEDNMQDFWNSWYAAVAHDPRHFFYTNLIRFPEGAVLNYHSFAYAQILVLVALSKLFGTDHATLIALQNATLLLSFPLAGTGAFYLVRHFAKSSAASLIGGFVFAFNPSHVAHVMHHAHVAWIGFIPFAVLSYLLALEKKSAAWLGAAIVFTALCGLSCWYYLFYIGYFIVFHTLYTCWRDNKLPRGWKLIAPLGCVFGAALLLSPLVWPMVLQAGPDVDYIGGNYYVADLAGYFIFPPTHLLARWVSGLYAKITVSPWEGAVYLGLFNLALLAWLGLRARHERGSFVYVLSGMAVFAVLASGETLHAFGHAFLFIHLPDIVLDKLPFFANVRTSSRAIVMVYLFLSIGVGQALAMAWARYRTTIARGAICAVAIMALLDFTPTHLAMTTAVCPKGLGVIARDNTPGFAVLNLPGGYIEGSAAMFMQTCHGRPILGGSVARITNFSLADHLRTDDLAAQRAQLVRAHVKYIVLSPEKDGLFVWKKADGPKAKYASTYRLAYRGADMTILQVY